MDTIAMGATIACAMELYERGHITEEDTDGIDLDLGQRSRDGRERGATGAARAFGKRRRRGSYRLAEASVTPSCP